MKTTSPKDGIRVQAGGVLVTVPWAAEAAVARGLRAPGPGWIGGGGGGGGACRGGAQVILALPSHRGKKQQAERGWLGDASRGPGGLAGGSCSEATAAPISAGPCAGRPAKLLPGHCCPLPWVHLISVTRIPVNLRPAWRLQQSRLHVPRLARPEYARSQLSSGDHPCASLAPGPILPVRRGCRQGELWRAPALYPGGIRGRGDQRGADAGPHQDAGGSREKHHGTAHQGRVGGTKAAPWHELGGLGTAAVSSRARGARAQLGILPGPFWLHCTGRGDQRGQSWPLGLILLGTSATCHLHLASAWSTDHNRAPTLSDQV
ncbi:uncharacterized protein LOC123356076 [Mauremys mutica]|uniref:uncharacterized protein LOC123356076 n=1 Tax=Mauremys mutica TaxID=74926 RepID=UPI001D169A02|nr:uncharacterized protein LOC123356076 [Mauremys mutica]